MSAFIGDCGDFRLTHRPDLESAGSPHVWMLEAHTGGIGNDLHTLVNKSDLTLMRREINRALKEA